MRNFRQSTTLEPRVGRLELANALIEYSPSSSSTSGVKKRGIFTCLCCASEI